MTQDPQLETTLSKTSVLVADDRYRAALYESWLPDRISVRTARSLSEARDEIDDSVRAALIRHEINESDKLELEAALAATPTNCRIAVTTSSQHEILYPDVVCDLSLHEPITESQVRDTVDRLIRRSLYVDGVARHYELSVRLASAELYPDEPGRAETAEDIEAQLERTDDFLDRIRRLLDADDHDAIITTLQRRNEDVRTGPTPQLRHDKYRPDRCSECKLDWNEYHGSRLGQGFRPLGSYTWRCTRCDATVSIPNPSDRTVARR